MTRNPPSLMPIVARDTWTNLNANYASSAFAGAMFYANDVGTNGSLWTNSGGVLVPVGPITLYTSTDSYSRAPTGTINTGSSGNITFGTAANRTYTEGLYVYLPSIATTPAITAGFYWCVMSSTTVGTLYASKGGAAINFTVGAGYTGVTSSVDLPAQTLKGGVMGSYRRLSISGILSVTNNANAKTTSIRFGGSTAGAASFQSAASWPFSANIQNKTASLQHLQPATSGTGAGSTSVTTINTASDQTYNPYLSGGGSTATDWWIVDCWQAVLFPH